MIIFINIFYSIDPLREEIQEAIEKCRHAGITVRY